MATGIVAPQDDPASHREELRCAPSQRSLGCSMRLVSTFAVGLMLTGCSLITVKGPPPFHQWERTRGLSDCTESYAMPLFDALVVPGLAWGLVTAANAAVTAA